MSAYRSDWWAGLTVDHLFAEHCPVCGLARRRMTRYDAQWITRARRAASFFLGAWRAGR